jgi:thiosulfate dehydrogenase [quinone] large subunit
MRTTTTNQPATAELASGRIARWLFHGWAGALLFLPLRLYFGIEWVKAGWEKVTDPAWMTTGKAVSGFAAGSIERGTAGDHPAVAYGWWVNFLEFLRDSTWFTPLLAKVIALGEVAIGVLLIVGLFTGIAAGLGATLNFSFMFSGSAGVNPAFLLAQVLLVAGWRVAGYLGADAWVLPRVRGAEARIGRWFRSLTHRGDRMLPRHA